MSSAIMKISDIRIPLSRILTIGLMPSPLKKLYYRMKGYKIGHGTSLGLGSVIDIANSHGMAFCLNVSDRRAGKEEGQRYG